MSLILSKFQYPALETFYNLHGSMSVAQAQRLDQRAFRSMLYRKYIDYRRGHGFHITRAGRQAWEEMHSTSIERKDPSRPLTAFFDMDLYGITLVAKPQKKSASKAA